MYRAVKTQTPIQNDRGLLHETDIHRYNMEIPCKFQSCAIILGIQRIMSYIDQMQPEIDIFIPRVVPSLNVWDHLHWQKKRRIKRDWYLEILAKRPRNLRTIRCCQIEITREYQNLSLDPDNLIAKPLMDALVRTGILLDDSEKVVRKYSINQKSQTARKIGTHIKIWRIDGDPSIAEGLSAPKSRD